MSGALNVLLLTNLYPNAAQVRHGVFIRERLRHLVEHPGLRFTVIAPVPWVPLADLVSDKYRTFARVPAMAEDLGVEVYHPRYFLLPRIGDAVTPLTFAAAVRRCIERRGLGTFDVIDAHFFFPDGAAAVRLGRELGVPVSVTARGSDLNVMLNEFFAGRWVRWAARHCDAAVGVSGALAERLRTAGAADERVHVIPNGVDRDKFEMRDRTEVRTRLGLDGPLLVSVGNLVEAKGHHHVIEALRELPGTRLAIIGDGPMRARLEHRVTELQLGSRVAFLGERRQDEIVDYYNAADALVLASSREGMPNVVLESMSCGTPVIATAAGGLAEFLAASRTAVRLDDTDAGSIAAAVRGLLNQPPARDEVRAEVADRDWTDTSRRVCDLLWQVAQPDVDQPRCQHAA